MSEMTSERKAKILQSAVDTYGASAQTDMMIEEMSELTKALLKYRRTGANSTPEESDLGAVPDEMVNCYIMLKESNLDPVLEEMADCYIMLNQMCLIYGDPIDWEVRKLEQLEARLGLIDGEPPF